MNPEIYNELRKRSDNVRQNYPFMKDDPWMRQINKFNDQIKLCFLAITGKKQGVQLYRIADKGIKFLETKFGPYTRWKPSTKRTLCFYLAWFYVIRALAIKNKKGKGYEALEALDTAKEVLHFAEGSEASKTFAQNVRDSIDSDLRNPISQPSSTTKPKGSSNGGAFLVILLIIAALIWAAENGMLSP